MNLPTKITFSRIVLVVLMFFGLVIYSICFDAMDLQPYEIVLFEVGIEKYTINVAYLIVCIVFIIAASTDFLDGYLARKNNQITDLGKFLDPIADKMLVNMCLILLSYPFPFLGEHQITVSVYIVIVFIVRDLIVDGLRFMAAKKNIVIAANKFGKLKTVFQMVAIPLFLLNGFPFIYFDYNFINYLRIADLFMYIALFFSVLSGIIYVYQNRKVFLGD